MIKIVVKKIDFNYPYPTNTFHIPDPTTDWWDESIWIYIKSCSKSGELDILNCEVRGLPSDLKRYMEDYVIKKYKPGMDLYQFGYANNIEDGTTTEECGFPYPNLKLINIEKIENYE